MAEEADEPATFPHRVWLIGENNPYGADPYFALYPEPDGCAGWRLCHLVLGMQPATYLRVFERRNLLHQPSWSAPRARKAAGVILQERRSTDALVLLGRKVFDAFAPYVSLEEGWLWNPFTAIGGDTLLLLPHPSGLCRLWSRPYAYAQARGALAQLAPHLAPLLGVGPKVRGLTPEEVTARTQRLSEMESTRRREYELHGRGVEGEGS